VTRRLLATAALCAALVAPATAGAQQDPNPATTAQTQTASAPATTPPATAPGATAPGATAPAATAPAATAPAATAPPATTPAPAPAHTAAQPTVRSGNDRAAVLLLLLVGALVLIALVVWAIARWQAWDPPWLARWRHATGEAGWRAGNAWAEFTDWLRLGR
jgi:hypothetical protein